MEKDENDSGNETFQLNLLMDEDIMDILHISRSSVRRLRNKNELPYVKFGATYYYPKDEFERTIREKLNKPFRVGL